MFDLITITLVSDNERHETSKPVEAKADDPHAVWSHVLDLAARSGLGDHPYLAEIAAAETGNPIYTLRCI